MRIDFNCLMDYSVQAACLNACWVLSQCYLHGRFFGTAMDSPVSVTIANLVMEDVEERVLTSYDIFLPSWKRYIDDLCTVAPKNRVQHLLQHLNGVEKSIQFTAKCESDGCLLSLDVKICRGRNGSLNTLVRRKATHTGIQDIL